MARTDIKAYKVIIKNLANASILKVKQGRIVHRSGQLAYGYNELKEARKASNQQVKKLIN